AGLSSSALAESVVKKESFLEMWAEPTVLAMTKIFDFRTTSAGSSERSSDGGRLSEPETSEGIGWGGCGRCGAAAGGSSICASGTSAVYRERPQGASGPTSDREGTRRLLIHILPAKEREARLSTAKGVVCRPEH